MHGDEEATLLPDGVQAALGWAVREAVTNVLRHSRATTCTIALHSAGGQTQLRVANDGTAQDVDGRWGNGLTGLAERLDASGGRLTAVREDDRFELTATLPAAVPA